jgi:hypothetical protein
MSSSRFALHLALTAIAALVSSAAMAAPKELYGKSIVISWSEDRVQRQVGETAFQSRLIAGGLSVYVSSQGNVFNRTSAASAQGNRRNIASHNYRFQGSRDQVGSAGNSKVSFQGHTMTAIQPSEHGARLITVTFDASFSGCTAEVIRGKEQGANAMVANSMIHPGVKVEIQSAKTSGASCSMKDGNVFE